MSIPYCQESILEFYRRVKSLLNHNKGLPSYIFKQEDTKFSRRETALPFSILVLKSSTIPSVKRYYILTNMHVSEAGGYGLIKVGYPINVYEHYTIIDFNRPTAIKILTQAQVISEDARCFMKETFKDIYSHGTVEKHCIKNPQKDQRVLTPRIKSEKIYYTMPLYSGEELLTYLTKFKFNLESKSDRAIVLNIMLKIAQEIQKIHQLDYVHLDIKPDNVIIQHNKDKNSLNIRLIDWDFLHKKSTVLRYKMGTERYRHPEVRIGSSVQPKFDVYSLGIFFNDIKEIFKISELEELITLMLNDNINIDEVIEKLSKLLKSNKFEEMTSNTDIESSSMCFLDPQLVKKDSSFQRHTLV